MHALKWAAALTSAAVLAVAAPAPFSRADSTTFTSSQWNIGSTDPDSGYGVHADQAWTTTAGAGSIVGVIDIGFLDHADLTGKLLPGYDFITDASAARDGDGRDDNPQDEGNYYSLDGNLVQASSWHGLHVSGTVAGGRSDGDTVGVAPESKTLPLRVGGTAEPTDADMAAAIRWGAGLPVGDLPNNPNHADVLNLSIAKIGTCPETLQAAIDAAVNEGTAVVVAAGNTWNTASADPLAVNYPANCHNVIRVTASDYTGKLTAFSNRGTEAVPATIAAPGAHVSSTWNTGQTLPVAGGDTYQTAGGTSMSSPHVAGVLALLRSMRPELSVDQLVASITATATPFADSTATAVGGAGIINAPAALAHALSLPTATPSATPSSSVTPSPSITPSASVTPTPSVSLSPNTTPTPSTIPPTTTVPPPSQAPRTSPPVPRFIESAAPKTSGKYRVGRKLKASKGKWTPTPTSYRYRWLRNGKKIKGATKATYKLTRSDRYKEISVKITVRRTGYPTTSANSSSHKIK